MLSAIKKIEAHFEGRLLAEIDPFTLHAKLQKQDSDFIVLDVRPLEAYCEGHIKGAVSFTLDDLEKRYNELPHGKIIIVYCWSHTCMLATKAALRLAKLGYHAKELLGGLAAWTASHYPTHKGKKGKGCMTCLL